MQTLTNEIDYESLPLYTIAIKPEMYFLYNLLLTLAVLSIFPFFLLYVLITGNYRNGFLQRLSLNSFRAENDSSLTPRLWIHACSVGEVTVIHPIISEIKRIYPSSYIAVSNTTKAGHEYAKKTLKDVSSYLYFPFDFWWVVKRVLKAVAPDIFVVSETEIWPNFLRVAKKSDIMIIMVNGRISLRSFGRYMKAKPFMRVVLQNLDMMSMISENDAERIIAMGAPPERVNVNGNSKYDRLADQIDPCFEKEVRTVLHISDEDKVFIAGSTRNGEEEIIIEAYVRLISIYPDMVMILAPRHIERKSDIEKLLRKKKLRFVLMTDLNKGKIRQNEQVVLIDTIGDLFKMYSVGTIIFCGGSLVPLGGHNVMEAAVWGKVVFYGPSMENFLDAKELLEQAGAGIEVNGADDLVQGSLQLMQEPERLLRLGEAGKKAVMVNRGSARKNALLIQELLDRKEFNLN